MLPPTHILRSKRIKLVIKSKSGINFIEPYNESVSILPALANSMKLNKF